MLYGLIEIRLAIGCTPYSLVYGGKIFLTLKVDIPSLKIPSEGTTIDEETIFVRLAQLEGLDERRVNALEHLMIYKNMIKKDIQQENQAKGIID